MSSPNGDVTAVKFRRINEVLAQARQTAGEPLFDEFWREGELALFFGEPGVGKSLLAVQIAEAIARGEPIANLAMPRTGRTVLYIDLVLSDVQFRARYSTNGEPYIFSDELYWICPPECD